MDVFNWILWEGEIMDKEKTRGESSAPMILSVVGGFIGLPSALCGAACAAGLTAAAGKKVGESNEAGGIFLGLGIAGALVGIIFGLFSRSKPKFSGFMLLLATVLTSLTIFAANLLGIVPAALFLIASILSFNQKMVSA